MNNPIYEISLGLLKRKPTVHNIVTVVRRAEDEELLEAYDNYANWFPDNYNLIGFLSGEIARRGLKR